MTRPQTQELLNCYAQKLPLLESWTDKVELLIKEILEEKKFKIHSITSRPKDKTSLERKIEKKPLDHYTKLEDITDLAGVRVITYFADDVDKIADVIKTEFSVDSKDSVDRRNQLDPESFGYLSVHYIVTLTPARAQLLEYRRFEGLKAEIQIRSLLQHAWAEIEHDLGYKTEGAIPRTLRRQFSRLAGLLELGDDEFIHIRDGLQEYENEVSSEIINSPQSVGLDKISIKSFIDTPLCQLADKEVAGAANGIIGSKNGDPKYDIDTSTSAEFSLQALNLAGYKSIGEIEERLKEYQQLFKPFITKWLPAVSPKPTTPQRMFHPGIGLFYLAVISVAKTKNVDHISAFWNQLLRADKHEPDITQTIESTLSVINDLENEAE